MIRFKCQYRALRTQPPRPLKKTKQNKTTPNPGIGV